MSWCTGCTAHHDDIYNLNPNGEENHRGDLADLVRREPVWHLTGRMPLQPSGSPPTVSPHHRTVGRRRALGHHRPRHHSRRSTDPAGAPPCCWPHSTGPAARSLRGLFPGGNSAACSRFHPTKFKELLWRVGDTRGSTVPAHDHDGCQPRGHAVGQRACRVGRRPYGPIPRRQGRR